jgi:hypothetical protein
MPNIADAAAKQPITELAVYTSSIKLRLIPLIAEYKRNNAVSAGADSLLKPKDMSRTKPKGANITTHPRGFNPVPSALMSEDKSIGDDANRYAKNADSANAANIHKNTFAINVFVFVIGLAAESTIV